ncbi:HTH-type transcriptional regulator HmrR [Roseomonas sp. TAS13]|uniref:MerR family copper efflux transcriptional regulator n=1 Tax=Muricoccus pecuniae TaxID=693023 RepID=A0A840YNJ5_9PROT|nr:MULTISPECIES: Cu(I)-responsive transcriptional regulator [Roseomonas]PZR09422.1 MAG: Cu(I)-responsive transcriptional regulator [Azospirillum brasilense]MBB5696584.1 MerR family copper efflux transcriptional regulator [Roseomonas pecuniae]MDT8355980.1 Cu(I)-responsive transcriptional regulator [Roseomonas mucosa]USQ74513.1 Cu(I)-responsive transcriptional regulator [Roseomonas mucosa]GAV33992.1 HTH-type transcriptional regulator HmrR [Roseomonas sp. TAS13]
MNIGQAARGSGISTKMLRYYESVGLLTTVRRTEAGYRVYSQDDVGTLRFVRRARDLGMPLDRIKHLIGLWQDEGRSSADVKRVATEHVVELRARITELTRMCEALEHMADACHGDHRPECPILEELADEGHCAPTPPEAARRKHRQGAAGKSPFGALQGVA